MSHDHDDYEGIDERGGTRGRAADAGDEVDLGTVIDFDGSDVTLPSVWENGCFAMMCSDIEPKTSKAGNRMLEVTHIGIEPEHKGQPCYDRVMLDGKGKARFIIWAQALGLWDDTTNKLKKGTTYANFLYKPFWADMENKTEVYVTDMGEEKTIEKSVVAFAGYHPITYRAAPFLTESKPPPAKKSEEPKPHDPFEE